MNRKLLVICPSYARPKIAERMYNSFLQTSSISDLLIIVDESDNSDYTIPIIRTRENTITDIYNKYFEIFFDNYEYFMPSNDDFVFHTKEWDRILIDKIEQRGGWGIAYGRNGINENLPMTSVISKNILNCMGYLQYPELRHLCGDCMFKDIGNGINRLLFCEDVFIEHKHFLANTAEKDETYKKTNSYENYQHDTEVYKKWFLKGERQRVINLVMSQMRESGAI